MWPKNRAAFTLSEMLLSASLMLLLAGSTMILYITLNRVWTESITITNLSRDAAIAMERMVKGMDGNDGIREAKTISSPAAGAAADQSISFVDVNGVSRVFYLDTADNTIKSESGDVLTHDAESASFTNSGDYIQIDLSTCKNISGKDVRFLIQTKIKPRN